MAKYSVRVAWSPSDEMFVATCPEFPYISGLGDTHQSALEELLPVIASAIRTYEKEAWPVPEPQLVEDYSGQFRLRVPKFVHAWLAAEADRQGVSLNTLAVSILAQAQGAYETLSQMKEQIRAAVTEAPVTIQDSPLSAETEVSVGTHNQGKLGYPPFKLIRGGEARTNLAFDLDRR